jgi:hypothetical protein
LGSSPPEQQNFKSGRETGPEVLKLTPIGEVSFEIDTSRLVDPYLAIALIHRGDGIEALPNLTLKIRLPIELKVVCLGAKVYIALGHVDSRACLTDY